MLPLHTPLTQSVPAAQALKSAHLLAQPPPQSTSVSEPFFAPSLQLPVVQKLAEQMPLTQSLPAVQDSPPAQRPQLDEPPQSTADSAPFFTTSAQVGTWQVFCGLPEQTPLEQSAAALHFLVSAHLAQEPPQLMSVSSPFCKPSLQDADWQKLFVHTPAWQSAEMPHALPGAHLAGQVPPQSTSVSLPFLTTSLQSGAAHWSSVQTPLTQSAGALQLSSSSHFGQAPPPPQSTSVSLPFWTPSGQAAA
jgi:hypothetical protein